MANSRFSIESIKHPDWLHFNGTLEDVGEKFILKAVNGGAFEMNKDDVWIGAETISVRNNASATIIEKPTKKSMEGISADMLAASRCVKQKDCPSKCCACIGLVRVCCGSGGTRGACLGVWGCPG